MSVVSCVLVWDRAMSGHRLPPFTEEFLVHVDTDDEAAGDILSAPDLPKVNEPHRDKRIVAKATAARVEQDYCRKRLWRVFVDYEAPMTTNSETDLELRNAASWAKDILCGAPTLQVQPCAGVIFDGIAPHRDVVSYAWGCNLVPVEMCLTETPMEPHKRTEYYIQQLNAGFMSSPDVRKAEGL